MVTTPFEDNGGTAWTTLAEEQTFLTAVAAGSSRMSYQQIATSPGGRRVDLVSVKIGQPNGRPLLVSGCPHGNEPSGREAALTLVRDLADTADATLTDYLAEHEVLVVPTTNPDGRASNARNNGANADLNRDWLKLVQPEVRAIVEVVRDFRPSVLLDMHENPGSDSGIQEFETETGLSWNTNGPLYQECIDAATGILLPAFTADSITNGWYRVVFASQQMSHHAMPLHGVMSFLSEAKAGGTGAGTMLERFQWSRLMIDTMVEWHRINGAALDALSLSARRDTAKRGITSTTWAVSGHRSNPRHSSSAATNITALGYSLTAAQKSSVDGAFTRHGVRSYESGDGYYVPLAQPLAGVIVGLVDPSHAERLVSATRLTSVPDFTGPDVLSAVAL